ncbi:MAG TPA: GNAT family N-acetyltransferase [Geminicoccaceae bacterium]|jgi:GNAT superfamily N-acetyltransferase|nr:GNAT family N-acetyltransferase [Geminicoccaceae bacterium]
MAAVTIREALPADAGTIVRLIRELAAYENMGDRVRITDADVLRDGFGARRCFESLLVEVDGQVVGLAIHRPSYSTFDGRTGLYVEDLFVAESARGLGVGRMLMARLAAIARERGCSRMTLAVLHWNPARAFYRRLGFVQVEDWLSYQLSGDALVGLADEDGRGGT